MKKLLSHKTANPFTTNEPQSCVFCEGGKTFLYKIHPVSSNWFKSLPFLLPKEGTACRRVLYLSMEGFDYAMVSPGRCPARNSPQDWHGICQGYISPVPFDAWFFGVSHIVFLSVLWTIAYIILPTVMFYITEKRKDGQHLQATTDAAIF